MDPELSQIDRIAHDDDLVVAGYGRGSLCERLHPNLPAADQERGSAASAHQRFTADAFARTGLPPPPQAP